MEKIVGLVLGLVLLAGCGGKGPAPQPASSAPPTSVPAPAPTTHAITFSNASSYIFNEIYISPTASNEWGSDLLGSTSLLKSNGSIQVEVPAYDYDNYDILVVDEDRDEYHFTRVPLQNGSEVAIYFGDDGLAADVYDARGTSTGTVYGTLEGSYGGGGDAPASQDWIEFSLGNGTSHITFSGVYLMPEGTTEESEMGYNHIDSFGAMEPGDTAAIGVDDHRVFDILLIDADGNGWYYQGIYLEAGCLAYPTNHNGAGFAVEYSDGTRNEYLGELY